MSARGRQARAGVLGALLLLACVPAWWLDRVAFLAAWLAAWLFCAGVVLGGLAIVWIHNLTHGRWGEPLRVPLLRLTRLLPWLALLFVPVLAGLGALYPWAGDAGQGTRWAEALSAPAFKRAWLQPDSFALRAVAVLLLWNLLAWLTRRPGWTRSAPFAAAALILYGLSVGVAAVDWIMSLMPLWYSSIFGLEVGVGQVLAGMAFAVLAARLPPGADAAQLGRDWGNLLLAFVLTWTYTAFAQWLVIWSENLPHEIAWYLARQRQPWLALGVVLVLVQFAAPLLLLLFRAVKESPVRLRRLAGVLLGAHVVEVWWLILPSVAGRTAAPYLLWLLPASLVGMVALGYGLLPAEHGFAHREVSHA